MTSTSRKILFMTIEGVLTSYRTANAAGGFPHGFTPDQMGRFDQTAVGMVRRLCADTGAVVVLTSSWRRIYPPLTVGRALGLPIASATPVFESTQGAEIAAWLAQHPDVTHYAIVTDDADLLPGQRSRTVRTSMAEGLTFAAYSLLKGILTLPTHPPLLPETTWTDQ